MGKLEQQMTRLEDAMASLAKTAEETWAAVREDAAVVRENSAATRQIGKEIREIGKEIREVGKEIREVGKEIRETTKETRADIREMQKEWGRLANKMGTLVEDIVAPGIPELFRERFGLDVDEDELEFSAQRQRRMHRRERGRIREFDYVAMAGKLLLVNETKSTLRPEDIGNFLNALREIRDYLPEAEGREVIGCLAAFSMDPTLVTAGERQGLLMVGLGTGLLRVLNSPDFVPHRF